MVGQQRKITKKKHWLERPKAVPPKTKFGPEYKCFKISYLTLFDITYFTIQFQSKSVTHFTNLNSLDILKWYASATQPKTFLEILQQTCFAWCQKKHLQYTISWRPRTTFLMHFESKCLRIFVYLRKKIFIPKT